MQGNSTSSPYWCHWYKIEDFALMILAYFLASQALFGQKDDLSLLTKQKKV